MTTNYSKNLVAVTGNTYPVKDALKSLGGKWNGKRKCWMVPADKAEKAQSLVAGAGPKQSFAKPNGVRKGTPKGPYNSPPPPDLGPIDIAAECAKHGRTPVCAVTVPFQRATEKGEDETGTTFWGRNNGVRNRYLVVRATRPTYLSRDYLEDMDQFSMEAGWYCSVEAVAVEPTEDEKSNDPAVKKALEEAKAKRRHEITSVVQKGHNAKEGAIDPRSYQSSTPGLVKLWGNRVYTLLVSGDHLVFRESSDDWAQWEIVDAALAAEALTLKAL